MKKAIYYGSPFLLVAAFAVITEYLHQSEIFTMNPFFLFGFLLVLSAVMGILTPTQRKFDLPMALILPLSLFCTMFTAGFLHREDLGSRFDFVRAIESAVQPFALLAYVLMASVALLASYQAFRMRKPKI